MNKGLKTCEHGRIENGEAPCPLCTGQSNAILVEKLKNFDMGMDTNRAQRTIEIVLDAVEEGFKTSAGETPDWSDKEEYLEIFSEAINKLR